MDEKSISQKLNAPKKISIFEKQRQEAESKRLREEAETRKALRDFEDSFAEEEDDDDDDPLSALAGGRGGAFGGGGGMRDGPGGSRGGAIEGSSLGGPRHSSQSMRNSGPGTLGPPPSLKRKRELEEERERKEREQRSRGGMRGFDNYDDDRSSRRKSPEAAVKRPTMLLAQLPKTMTQDEIRQLMPASLKVEEVAFVPPQGPGTDKRYSSAIVTVAASTPMSDVDGAVSTLQGKYLGFGCHLNISRHITSTLNNSATSAMSSHAISTQMDFQPFGAKAWIRDPQTHSLRNAPPPDSLGSAGPGWQSYNNQPLRNQGPPTMVVQVTPPSDLKLLQAVHKTAEKIIKYGATFERALISSPAVQHDESWAWIFDPSSQASVYYRWLLYEYTVGNQLRAAKSSTNSSATLAALKEDEQWQRSPEGQFAAQNGLLKLFSHGPLWRPPPLSQRPKFEFVTEFEHLVDDPGYVSSDDESGDEAASRPDPPTDVSLAANTNASGYLESYRRAKLTHLLARLPDSIAMLRAGDVARITSFVVAHAGSGADEIVSMLVENITHPYSRAVVYETPLSDAEDVSDTELTDEAWERRETRRKNEEEKRRADPSNAKLIALYVVSDALQASSTSGVRDAWKYRGLFESSLRARGVFEHLGRLEKRYHWGRIKAEQWKRKVGVVLTLWENWSVFSAETQRTFKEGFFSPPLTAEEQTEKDRIEQEEREKRELTRWKSGATTPGTAAAAASADVPNAATPTAPDTQSTAPSVSAPPDQTPTQSTEQAEIDAKKRVFTDKLAALKKSASAARAARPTAADLLDKKEEPPRPVPVPPPAPVAPPKISVGGFKISLGAGGSGAGSGGLSLSGKKKDFEEILDDAEGVSKEKVRDRRGLDAAMFGDSDGE